MINCEPLEVNTKGICLLCFNSSSSVTTRATSYHGFKQLLRYLQVNTKSLFNCSTQFLQTMQIGEEIDVRITLCTECSAVTEKFDKLYHEYELIRLQFDNCVHTLHQSMKNGEESPQLLQQYVDQMRPHKATDLVNASIASNLRSETFKKCEQKLQGSSPRIIVQKPNQQLTIMPPTFAPTDPDSDSDTDNDHTEADDEVHGEHFSPSPEPNVYNDDKLENDNPTGSASTCKLCKRKLEGNSRQCHRDHWVKYHYYHLIAYQLPKGTSVKSCKKFGSELIDQMLSKGSCHHCNQKVTNKVQLLTHLMSTHEEAFASQVLAEITKPGETETEPIASPFMKEEAQTSQLSHKPFKCSKCSKTFHCKYMLTRHKLTHTQRYSCNFCEFVSGYSFNLKAHILEKHTVELVMPHFQLGISKERVENAVTQVGKIYSRYKTQCPKCSFTCENTTRPKIRRHVLQRHFEEFVNEVKTIVKAKEDDKVVGSESEDEEPMDVVNSVQIKYEINQ